MRVLSVEFAGAIGQPGQAPPGDLLAIAFAGRSNVGKSSLINRLLGRTRTAIARVSAQPGKTQEINFYQVRVRSDEAGDAEFYLADLPGYGYARVPMELRGRWKPLIEGYLTDPRVRGVVQLVDARHSPTDEDRAMLDYLAARELPTLVALTKVDKLKGNQRRSGLERRSTELGLESEQLLTVSATTGEGCDDLLSSMESLIFNGDDA